MTTDVPLLDVRGLLKEFPARGVLRKRPPVVAVADGTSRVLVRRETEDDLLALDVG